MPQADISIGWANTAWWPASSRAARLIIVPGPTSYAVATPVRSMTGTSVRTMPPSSAGPPGLSGP